MSTFESRIIIDFKKKFPFISTAGADDSFAFLGHEWIGWIVIKAFFLIQSTLISMKVGSIIELLLNKPLRSRLVTFIYYSVKLLRRYQPVSDYGIS